MSDTPAEPAPTEELSLHALTVSRALNLIESAEHVIGDMHRQVNELEETCAITRARIAQRNARQG